MTRYILENLDARGTYYVRSLDPFLSPPHRVEITNVKAAAAGFDSATEASLTAARITGRWQWVAA